MRKITVPTEKGKTTNMEENIMEICGDNRFEIIQKAKDDILENTNIGYCQDEMKVLDTFLYRAWQMGWLEQYNG